MSQAGQDAPKPAPAHPRTRSARPPLTRWWIPVGLLLLCIAPSFGGAARLSEVVGGAEVTAGNARFLAAPIATLLHIVPALLFGVLGAFQLWPSFRRRHPRWHRLAGRVLVPAGFAVALTGLWMTLTFPWPAGDGVGVFVERLVFGSAMLASMVLGVRALVRRRFAEHGDWMLRAYAIGMGAGTQVLTHLPWFILVDLEPGETPRAIMMGLGWVINVVVAERIIRRPKTLRLRSAPARTGLFDATPIG